ncbi:MAG: GNAT family N-acetyltransferase [Bryobacteraceae bacterium]
MDVQPASLPERVSLSGRLITLEPLDPQRHGDCLWQRLSGAENDSLWEYLADGPFADRPGFDSYLLKRANSTEAFTYAIVEKHSGLALGIASLMRIDRANRVIEVGGIHYSRALRRTTAATEAMYLLARYCFESLRYRRYEWKCNALNTSSRRAAERLGFTFEGIFRQHMIVKKRNRDTAWYSMLDREWPEPKGRLEAWLHPENFREDGTQLQSLGQT